jgi:hypothetical protein
MVEEIQKSNKRQSEYELIDVPSKYRDNSEYGWEQIDYLILFSVSKYFNTYAYIVINTYWLQHQADNV